MGVGSLLSQGRKRGIFLHLEGKTAKLRQRKKKGGNTIESLPTPRGHQVTKRRKDPASEEGEEERYPAGREEERGNGRMQGAKTFSRVEKKRSYSTAMRGANSKKGEGGVRDRGASCAPSPIKESHIAEGKKQMR